MSARHRFWAGSGRGLLGVLVCAFAGPSLCWADVWAFVDEKGVAHFASAPLDERYQLFARVEAPTVVVTSAPKDVKDKYPLVTPPPDTGRERFLSLMEKSPDYRLAKPLLGEAAKRHGVDLHLLLALIATESGFDRKAVSPKGAVGLMQLMPTTAQRFGVNGRAGQSLAALLTDPATNIETGTRYLHYLQNLYAGQPELALAAYNAGEGAVAKAGGKIPNFPETQNYVKTVTQLHRVLKGNVAPPVAEVAAQITAVRISTPVPMMVPGAVQGRNNMVPPLTLQTSTLLLPVPASPDGAGRQ